MINSEKSLPLDNVPTSELLTVLKLIQSEMPIPHSIPYAASGISLITPSQFLIYYNKELSVFDLSNDSIISEMTASDTISSITNTELWCFASIDNEIFKYSIPSLKYIENLSGHTSTILCMKCTAQALISGSEDCSVRFWDLQNLIETKDKILYSHDYKVQAVDLSSNSELAVSLGYDGFIKVFNIIKDVLMQTLDCDYNSKSVKISPFNHYLAATSNKTINIWRMDDWINHDVIAHESKINTIEYTKDERLIVSGADDGSISVTNIRTGCFQSSSVHINRINGIAVSFDHKALSVSDDCTLIVSSIKEPEGNLKISKEILKVSCFVVICESVVVFGDIDDRPYMQIIEIIGLNQMEPCAIEFKVNYAHKICENALCSCEDKYIRAINHKGEVLTTFDIQWESLAVCASRFIGFCTGELTLFLYPALEKVLTIYRKDNFSSIGLFPNSLILGEYNGILRVYHLNDTSNPAHLEGHTVKILGISQSNDSKFLFTSDLSPLVIIWDFRTLSIIRKLNILVESLYPTQDSLYLLMCSGTQLAFYSLSTFDRVTEIRGEYSCSMVALSSNEEKVFVKEIESVYALDNHLAKKIFSVGGTSFDKIEYFKYVLSTQYKPKYKQLMDQWIIMPYRLNTMHFYAYFNHPELLFQGLSEGSPYVISEANNSPLSISISRNFDQCTRSIYKALLIRSQQNPYYLRCLEGLMIDLNSSSFENIHKFYNLILHKSPLKMPNFCRESVKLPYIKTSDQIIPQDEIFSGPEFEGSEQNIAIKVVQSFVGFEVAIGSAGSVKFLRSLIRCDKPQVFKCRLIRILLEEKWRMLQLYLYSEAVVYLIYLVLISVYASYPHREIIETAFALNLLLLLHCILKLLLNPISFIRSTWNYLEISNSLLMVLFTVLIWSEYSETKELFSVLMILSWMRGIIFFRLFTGTRYYLNLLASVLLDIIPFFIIYFYSTIGFALVFQALDGDHSSYFDYLTGAYLTQLGSSNTDGYSLMHWLFFLMITVLNQIVMLNLIISIMSDTYSRVQEAQIEADSIEMIQMLLDIEAIMFWNKTRSEFKYFFICDQGSSVDENKDFRMKLKSLKSTLNNFLTQTKKISDDNSRVLNDISNNTSQQRNLLQEITLTLNRRR